MESRSAQPSFRGWWCAACALDTRKGAGAIVLTLQVNMADRLCHSRQGVYSFLDVCADCKQTSFSKRVTAFSSVSLRIHLREKDSIAGGCFASCKLQHNHLRLQSTSARSLKIRSAGTTSPQVGTFSSSYQLQNEHSVARSNFDRIPDPPKSRKSVVLVSNLSPQTSLQEVESFFDSFGPLELVQLSDASSGSLSAAVHFLEPWAAESAAAAVQKADGKIWKNHRLRVFFEGTAQAKKFEKYQSRAPVIENQNEARPGNRESKFGVKDLDEFHDEINPELPEGKIKLRFRQEVTQERPNFQEAEILFNQLAFPTMWEYCGMLRVYALSRQKHKARSLVEHMKGTGSQPSRLAYTNLLQAYTNSGDIQGATSVLEEMEANGVPPDGAAYGHLVLHYARAKDRRKVVELVDLMKRLKLEIPVNVYSAAINAYIQLKAMRPAHELFEEMEREGMQIPLTAHNAILDGYASAGDERGALKTYERLRASGLNPCGFTFSGLIKLYTRKGKMADAMRVVEEMQSLGIRHSKQSHSMLISGHAGVGDVEAAYATFQDMARSKNRPDVIAYTSIIACFAKAGQMERAVDMLASMTQEGLRPNHYTYTALIDGWAKQGNLAKAMDTIRDMRASGIVPTVATFTVIIQALARTGQLNLAAKVVEEMRRLNVPPDTRVFTTLISGYANIGDVFSAFEVFKKVKAEGFPLDKRIYTTLINACAKVGRMQSAVAIVGEMRAVGIEPDVITYNALLDGWAKRGDIWEAADVMEQMEAAGVRPNVTSFCTLIYACMKGSEMDKALAVLDEMQLLGFKPTLEIFNILIEGWCQAGQPQKALSVFAQLKGEGLEPDWPVYHCLMSGLLQNAARDASGLQGDVIRFAGEVQGRGYKTDTATAFFWNKQLRFVEGQVSASDFRELSDAVRSLFPPTFRQRRQADQSSDESTGRPLEKDSSELERSEDPSNRPSTSQERESMKYFSEDGGRSKQSREARRVERRREEAAIAEDLLQNLVRERQGLDRDRVEIPGDEAGPSDVAEDITDGADEPSRTRGAWRNPKQQRTLEASKEWETKYASSRMEEMLTFLTQAERDALGPGYELIDSASKLAVPEDDQ